MNWGWTRLEGAAATVYGDTCCGRISDAGLSQLSFGESAMTFYFHWFYVHLSWYLDITVGKYEENISMPTLWVHSYATWSKLKRHIKSVHKGERFPCSDCEHTATQKCNLRTHIKTIHKGVTFLCPDCKFTTAQKGNLQRHIQSVHEGATFSCQDCDYKAKLKTDLNSHIKSVHKGIIFPCPDCKYIDTSNQFMKWRWNISMPRLWVQRYTEK